MKYALIDSSNLFFRSVSVSYNNDIDLKVGLSLNIFLNSLNNIEKIFSPNHYVICLDSKSWRTFVYEKYKLARRKKYLSLSEKEREENFVLSKAYEDMVSFFDEKTNMTVLKCEGLEADDLISFWINFHKDDENIIVSLDSDFVQLLRNNAIIYNSNKNIIITKSGCYDVKDKKIPFSINSQGKVVFKEDKEILIDNNNDEWYEWALFLKIMRGDISDGIESVLPKVRKDVLRKAFEDRKSKGFDWNKLMYQELKDDNNNVYRVIDKYKFNKMLIDLNEQPEEIKNLGYEYINNISPKSKNHIGFNFLKFCNKYELKRIENNSEYYVKFLSKKYEKK